MIMVVCSSCGINIKDGSFCSRCSRKPNFLVDEVKTKKASYFWFLLPIFLGIIGGGGAYYWLRKSDPQKAKICLIIGLAMTTLFFLPSVWNSDFETKDNVDSKRISQINDIKSEQEKIEKELELQQRVELQKQIDLQRQEELREEELVKQEESKTEPIEIDKEEQVLSFIKNYKGTDNSGFTLMDAIAMMLNVMYPGEDIISSPATSGYLVASSDYRKEISDRYWKVELNLDLYDGEIYFEWIVDTETNSVSPGNQLGKDVLTLLDIKG